MITFIFYNRTTEREQVIVAIGEKSAWFKLIDKYGNIDDWILKL